MSKQISLQRIIEEVLNEKGITIDDNCVRFLRRKFDGFLERMGGNKSILKGTGRTISFDESEISFIKVIMSQLYDNEGLIAHFLDKKLSDINSKDIHNMIQAIIDEESNKGVSEDEIARLAKFLDKKFLCMKLYLIESCHKLIDALELNTQDLTISQQEIYWCNVLHILKKEVSLRIAESVINCKEIIETINLLGIIENDTDVIDYQDYEYETREEYITRDKNVLTKIQEDEDLRYYIEKIFNKKAEDIFKYAIN